MAWCVYNACTMGTFLYYTDRRDLYYTFDFWFARLLPKNRVESVQQKSTKKKVAQAWFWGKRNVTIERIHNLRSKKDTSKQALCRFVKKNNNLEFLIVLFLICIDYPSALWFVLFIQWVLLHIFEFWLQSKIDGFVWTSNNLSNSALQK